MFASQTLGTTRNGQHAYHNQPLKEYKMKNLTYLTNIPWAKSSPHVSSKP